MGKVIYDLFVANEPTWFVVVWFLIAATMIHRRYLGRKFERLEATYLGPKRRKQVEAKGNNNYKVTDIVTCAHEDPEVFERAMSKLRQQEGLADHKIIIVVDAIDDVETADPDSKRCLEIASRYADFVLVTNHCDKRENIRAAMKFAREKGVLHDLVGVVDSDTVCDHPWVTAQLAYEFHNDPKVGAVTTAQRCLRTDTLPELIGDWLENARLKSSMAAGSLYGQVGCVPGRYGIYRTCLIEHRMDELAEEVWRGNYKPRWPTLDNLWPFESWEVKCKAGDDRQLTNFVLEAGYKTVLVLSAGVKTLVPEHWTKLWKTWRRWGTSSQGYVYRTLFGPKYWLWQKKFVLYHYSTDIVITHVSCFLQLMWVYSLFFSRDQLLLPFSTVLGMSLLGVLGTFLWRQWPHLREQPRDVVILPVFVLVIMLAQFVRLWAHYTPWRIGTWSTRGVDAGSRVPTYCEEYRPAT